MRFFELLNKIINFLLTLLIICATLLIMGNKINKVEKMFTVTITQSGQATIPKEVREVLGVEPGERISYSISRGGEVRITRELSDDDFLVQLDALKSPESIAREREVAKEYAGMSIGEMVDAWAASPEGQEELRKEYLDA